MSILDRDIVTEMLLTTEEARTLVKQSERIKGSRFAVYVPLDAYVVDKPGFVFSGGCSSYVDLSKAEALRLVSGMLSPGMEDRGGRIRIKKRETPPEGSLPGAISYWIG
jgi:hypothetical protein